MKYKQNLHTHSIFCDGKNTPRETALKAIDLGFASVGFSGHSYMPYSPLYGMIPEKEDTYFDEVTALKKEFEGKLDIFCGIEYDMYSDLDISRYDYSIGSLHYFLIDGEYVGFDRSADEVESVINRYFGGKGIKYAEKYYETLTELPKHGDFDIIGHFDLLTKHSESRSFFDTEAPEYLSYAFEAASALRDKIPLFEVNTGAISRGYRTTPYPSIPILKELNRLGYGAIISSDCHNADMLDCHYKESEELLKHCGFGEYYILTADGFTSIPFE